MPITERKLTLDMPFHPYSGAPHLRRVVTDRDHVPFNKRRHQVESSVARFTATAMPGGDWVTVEMEETTKSHSGTVQTRTISMSIPAAFADSMGDVLKATKMASYAERVAGEVKS